MEGDDSARDKLQARSGSQINSDRTVSLTVGRRLSKKAQFEPLLGPGAFIVYCSVNQVGRTKPTLRTEEILRPVNAKDVPFSPGSLEEDSDRASQLIRTRIHFHSVALAPSEVFRSCLDVRSVS